jgi:putative membrane protein
MSLEKLPALNALLNTTSFALLWLGFFFIKKGRRIKRHKASMLSALFASALFLTSYSIYHAQVGSVPYPHHDWTRIFYFSILIPHVILAAVMVPLILSAVYLALRKKYASHKKMVKWAWPIWIFVSLSGVIVYVMLYRL